MFTIQLSLNSLKNILEKSTSLKQVTKVLERPLNSKDAGLNIGKGEDGRPNKWDARSPMSDVG